MADYDVHVILKNASALPRDQTINVLHFDVNAPDTLEGLCDGLNLAWFTINGLLAADVNGMDIKVYEPGLNPAGPVFTKTYTNITGGTGSGPAEIACCLSYATVDNPLASTPRRRGRVYIGPFSAGQVGTARPGMRSNVLDLGEAIASVGTAGNTTWKLYSKADNSYHKIESIWVDDAWDVQRRRGYAPTLRDVRDVQ